MDIQAKTDFIDSRRIDYTSSTVFLVQVGRGKKSNYTTRYEIIGDLSQAMRYYDSLKIDPGRKKRLLMPSSRRPVLARRHT